MRRLLSSQYAQLDFLLRRRRICFGNQTTERETMNKVFLFARTDAVVVPEGDTSSGLREAVATALDRTVTVQTPEMVGAGAILGDRIITSLLLVANFLEVTVRFFRGKSMRAFVARKDPERNLAELLPITRALSSSDRCPLASTVNPKSGETGEVGHPLLVVDVVSDAPSVQVAATLYGVRVCERLAESWRIRSNAPRGLIGGAVWDLEGRLIGLAVGERISPPESSTKRDLPSVYALPAEQVMHFVETRN